VATIDIASLIICSPELRGGRPRLAGTGVTVHRVAGWYKLGMTPEEIAHRLGHLTLAQVYAALAYFHANREQIETELQRDDVEADQLEAMHTTPKQ